MLEFGDDLKKMVLEYEEREELVAKCTKDADTVVQVMMEWSLMWRGNKLVEKWYEGDFVHRLPGLRTESAKQIMQELKNSNPNEWWWVEIVERGINYEHLNGKK
jgi:5'-deoxynucleotidase YfbR-like HD superfamily hydrolase